MPLEKIYVVRHGFRSGWHVDAATGTYSNYIPSPTGIPADPALTSHGVGQAGELGRHLGTLEPPVEAVYSSPFYRCLQTVAPFLRSAAVLKQREAGGGAPGSRGVDARIRPEHGIREWFGSAPFAHPQPATSDVLKSFFPEVDENYESVIVPSPRGETLAELQKRVAIALRGIIGQCDAQGHRSALLCTHAAVVIMLGRVLTGQVPDSVDAEDFDAYTCGLSVFQREAGRGSGGGTTLPTDSSDGGLIGGWLCELNSDCSFLSSGPERGWKFSGDESFPDTGSLSKDNAEPRL